MVALAGSTPTQVLQALPPAAAAAAQRLAIAVPVLLEG